MEKCMCVVWNFRMSIPAQVNVNMSWAVRLELDQNTKISKVVTGQLKLSCLKCPLLLPWEIRQICLLKLQLGNLTYLGHCLEHWSFKQVIHSKGRISWYFHFLKDEKLKVTHVKILLMRLTWSRRNTSREK